MKYHLDVLNTRQQRVLRRAGPMLAEKGFYLAGGTAIAIWLGHRRSVDLDWFTGNPFTDPARLAHDLDQQGIRLTGAALSQGTLQGRIDRLRVSFFEHPYPTLRPPVRCPELGCLLASEPDLAAMKLLALSQRGARKDFIDLYVLARKQHSLAGMVQFYEQKYATDDLAHLLKSLDYFKDAAQERPPKMLWEVDWRNVQKAFVRWAEQLRQ